MSMLQRDESRHDFAFIAGVIVGAISGALVTLALTPMSGAETREKLRARADDLGPVKERAAGMAAPVRERAGTLAASGKERAQHLAATGKERAAELAARAPIRRGDAGPEVDTLIDPNDPNAHPGGRVTPAALAEADDTRDAGMASATTATAAPPPVHTQEPAEGAVDPGSAAATPPRAHAQEPAEGERGAATESGNGRVNESPTSGSRPDGA